MLINKLIGVLEENTKLVLVFVDNARLDRVTNEEKKNELLIRVWSHAC